jgi:hypothetical protein
MIEIGTIIKNESAYLKEWIEHHLALGFDRIVLYDNGSTPSLYDDVELWKSLKPSDQSKVIVKIWTEDHAQRQCYTHHAQTTDAEWTAYIDADEFIMLRNHATIREFLATFGAGIGAVCLHWILYGANGHVEKPEGGVIESYTKPCSNPVSDLYKTIARSRLVNHFTDPHSCRLVAGLTVNDDGRSVDPKNPSFAHAWINHYYTKSLEEWTEKVERGRADSNSKRSWDEFFQHNPDMKETHG